ncbi:MAG: 50S ribosomal protein L9 [Kiritimatiellia bacterium]|jgi:large subunit ribosomal protein L9
MATEILLMSDVKDLGVAGDVVKVADGYARNFLLPRGLAAPVTQASLRRLEKLRKEREELARIQLAEARAKADQIKKASVTIRAKSIDGTNLYGSVGVADIVEALGSQGIAIDRTQVKLDEPFKALGTYDVEIKLHADVSVTVKAWVVED